MSKYRITIEDMEGTQFKGDKIYEMEGFVLFGKPAKAEACSTVVVQEMSINELAQHIAADNDLLQAAIIAKGMYEAYTAKEAMDRAKRLDKIMGGAVQ